MARILAVLHAAEEHLGALEPPLVAAGHLLDTRAMPGPLPSSLDEHDAIVVMGGSMGVYEADRYPFLRDEIRLLTEALERGRPALGVCLGSQLLASAGGARVRPGPSVEVGWLPVRRLQTDRWMPDWPEVFEPLHWHGDTFDLPAGATLLASSEAYAHQAFRLGSGLALQFHVEATAEMTLDWWAQPGLGARWRPPDGHVERTATAAARMAPLVRALAKAFGSAAEGVSRSR